MKKDNIHLNNWSCLIPFGINVLTGEACAFSMRLLCDLNEMGRALVAEYLGVTRDGFAAPWNSSVNGEPSLASVMLHRDSFLQVAEFALFRDGALAVAPLTGGILGIYDQEEFDRWALRESLNPQLVRGFKRNYALASQAPQVGTRNVHAATARAV